VDSINLWEWISKEPLNLPKMQATKRQRNKEHRKKKGKSAAKAQKALSKGDHNGTV